MAKYYTEEERIEALKLANEIGAAAAARRFGIKESTIYGRLQFRCQKRKMKVSVISRPCELLHIR